MTYFHETHYDPLTESDFTRFIKCIEYDRFMHITGDEIWEERQEAIRNLKTIYGDKMGLLTEGDPCPCGYDIYHKIVDDWDEDKLPQIIHRDGWTESSEDGTEYYGYVQVRCPRCGSYWQIGDECY